MSFKAIPGGLAARAPQASPNPPGTGPEGCLAAGLMGAFFPFPPKQIPLCVVTNLRTCSRECALSVQRFVLSLKTKFHRKLKNSWKKINKPTTSQQHVEKKYIIIKNCEAPRRNYGPGVLSARQWPRPRRGGQAADPCARGRWRAERPFPGQEGAGERRPRHR